MWAMWSPRTAEAMIAYTCSLDPPVSIPTAFYLQWQRTIKKRQIRRLAAKLDDMGSIPGTAREKERTDSHKVALTSN